MTPAEDRDIEHQVLVGDIGHPLLQRVPKNLTPLLGVNVIAGQHTLVVPDVAVVDLAYAVRGNDGVSPDGLRLAVEITSPSTRLRDLTIKREIYRGWGVPLLVVDREQTPHAYLAHGEMPEWATGIDTAERLRQ